MAYERVLPFLNRQPLETTIAQSSACGETWVTVPRNIQDDTHVWLVWSTMRSALRCCGVGLSESVVVSAVGGAVGGGVGGVGGGAVVVPSRPLRVVFPSFDPNCGFVRGVMVGTAFVD